MIPFNVNEHMHLFQHTEQSEQVSPNQHHATGIVYFSSLYYVLGPLTIQKQSAMFCLYKSTKSKVLLFFCYDFLC